MYQLVIMIVDICRRIQREAD